jgi:hypothetical protein
MRRVLILLVACACIAALLAAGTAPAKRSSDECTWGASSVLVQEVSGRLVQSDPVTTGCIPR